jgi:Ser/Thr protein kinase RdoA (MazF antagonist)
MILTRNNLADYLLERGLLSFESVVDGNLMVVEASRRNRNFKVIRKNHPGYFVKQIKEWEPQSIATLQCEATCYWLAQNDPRLSETDLVQLMPRYYFYDSSRHALVTELLPDGENLSEYHRRLGKFPMEIARQLGRRLGGYHRDAGEGLKESPHASVFTRKVPWVLSVHQHSALLFNPLSAANARLLEIVRAYPEFQERLDALRAEWQVNGLIHGDMKWDNCLVCAEDQENGESALKVVDWEMADLGDVCWDVGAIFQAYLSFWISSIPSTGEAPSPELIARAQYPLEEMQPAIRAFWETYAESFEAAKRQELLERSMKYGAARMIQTAYEWMYYSQQVTASTLYLLQVSMNILKNPTEAISSLLGL